MNIVDMDVTFVDRKTYRLIPSCYPPIDVLERVASKDDFDILFEIESLTNSRLRDEIGEIALVPKEERLFGRGTSLIMASFTHLPLVGQGGRFNRDYGAYYCAAEFKTALEETKYHRAKFFLNFKSKPTKIDMRELITDLKQDLHSIAGQQENLADVYHHEDYTASQIVGRQLREASSWGLEYSSVRIDKGVCYVVFRPPALSNCRQSRHFEYHFDGEKIAHVIEKHEVK